MLSRAESSHGGWKIDKYKLFDKKEDGLWSEQSG